MKERFEKQNKETRLYIMSAVLFFAGFDPINGMDDVRAYALLDILGLTKEEVESFPIPDYDQLLTHLKPIADYDIRDWVINATYYPVLSSQKEEAVRVFRTFCFDLKWDINEIKESIKLQEEIREMKPIEKIFSNITPSTPTKTNSGCLSVMVLLLVNAVIITLTIK